jgi:hypothetical protein
MLVEQPIVPTQRGLSDNALAYVEEGRSRFRTVDCFDFVPSDYELVWRTLDGLTRGRFCEWGSGFGIATGLAEMLGFEAMGIEINARIADASRQLLTDFGLSARIRNRRLSGACS